MPLQKVLRSTLGWILNSNGTSKGVKILIAEDDISLATALSQTLSSLGVIVSIVHSVEGAMRVLAEYDLLFLDLTLLGGRGEIVLDRWVMQKSRGKVCGPVCILTGGLQPADIESYLSRGAWNVLLKPFDLATIHVLVHRYSVFIAQQVLVKEIAILKRLVLVLFVLVVALIGKDVVPLVAGIF